jgi:4-hydroxy-tetrahydrodipicolinate synthase
MMSGPMFKGSLCATITPFTNGAVDEKAYQEFLQWHIDQGTHGVISCGTTGESPTVSHPENKRINELAVEVCKGRIPVLAGTGSNNTAEAIDLTRHAAEAGADAALVVTPYYNKPSQEGMYQHYKAIHDATDIPIVIYNIPGRCIVDMSVETMARLAELPRIVGVKDCSGDPKRPFNTRRAIGEEFALLSGEDPGIMGFLALGGHGCISVTANVAPGPLSQMHEAWQRGDVTTAQQINDRLMPLHDALFCEPSPAPAKYGASLLGFGSESVRLPMVPCSAAAKAQVREAMTHAGLLN